MDYGTYCDLTVLKAAMAITATDTADDSRLLTALEDVSRFIDQHTQRHFFAKTETRYYSPTSGTILRLDSDLLSVTTLKADQDGDRTYEETWAVTDYDLTPDNEWPKTAIEVTPDGVYSFPTGGRRGVEIAGLWGFGRGDGATSYEASGTTTSEVLDTSETGVDVASGAALAVGQTILVDSEQMYITGISTNTATVVRGVNGTTAATHDTGKAVYIYRYPANIRRACIMLAEQTFKQESAAFGVSGGAEVAVEQLQPSNRAQILHWMAPFRNLSVG